MDKKIIGYGIAGLNAVGSIFTGLLGLAFIILAVYLVWYDINNSQFRTKSIMMPAMNILISSMLFYYCRLLYGRARLTGRQVRTGTYTKPRLRITGPDILATLAFIVFVGLVSYLLF